MTDADDDVCSRVKDLMADGRTRTWREIADTLYPSYDPDVISVEGLSAAEAISRMCEDGTLDRLSSAPPAYRLHRRGRPYDILLSIACLKRDAESYSMEALCEDEAASYARAFVHMCRAMDCVRSGMRFHDSAERGDP